MKLWLVAQNRNHEPVEIQGIFDSEEKAILACKNENYWIGPLFLNKEFPQDPTPWEGAYFPHMK